MLDFATTPYAEAIEFLEDKIPQDTDSWRDIWREQHDTTFVVAGAKGALLQGFFEAIQRAIREGRSLQQFMTEDFDRLVAASGWDYRGDRNWRAAIIYNTNLRTAYAAGRYQQLSDPEMLRRRPYWEWRHGDSRQPRPVHLALDGKIFRGDSVFWQTMHPPAGYGCKCRVFALSQADLDAEGKQAEEPPRVGDTMRVADPVTGEERELIIRPDPGWDYVPGRSTLAQRRAAAVQRLDPRLQAQIQGEVANVDD